jgi:hypothetical protein
MIRREWLPAVSAAIGSLTGAGAAFGFQYLRISNGAYYGGSFGPIVEAIADLFLIVSLGAAIGGCAGFFVGTRLGERSP